MATAEVQSASAALSEEPAAEEVISESSTEREMSKDEEVAELVLEKPSEEPQEITKESTPKEPRETAKETTPAELQETAKEVPPAVQVPIEGETKAVEETAEAEGKAEEAPKLEVSTVETTEKTTEISETSANPAEDEASKDEEAHAEEEEDATKDASAEQSE